MTVLDLLVGLRLGAGFSEPRGSLWSEGLGLKTFVGAMSNVREYVSFKRTRNDKRYTMDTF